MLYLKYKNLKIMLENLKQFEIEKEQLIHVYGGSLVVNTGDDDDDNIVDGTEHVKNKR